MNYHKLIRALINEVRQLRDELADSPGPVYDYAERAEENANRRIRELERKQQDAKREADYKQWEYDSAVAALDKAKRYGNEYEEEKALRRLKAIY